jgi:hypothetical protein
MHGKSKLEKCGETFLTFGGKEKENHENLQ